MIWYLLYPLRGTTEAPVLAPSHPLRSLFARYGRYAARHVVTTLLISAAVATTLIYPIPFIFTNDVVNGASNFPHHVWTVAQPLPYGSAVEPDITMRSVWTHAGYMQALNSDLLLSTLEIQDELLGPTRDRSSGKPQGDRPSSSGDSQGNDIASDELSLVQRDALHVENGLNDQAWFFHSPLMYWDCSRDRILADPDVVATVNDRKNQSTSANVTLRHSMVFSGKQFEDRRLLRADALVITLFHLRDSPIGRQWEKRTAELAADAEDEWDIYPPDGRVENSQLYEFQFRPMSTQDSLLLTVAYGLSGLYFILSLSRLRAVKSKIGLIVTVVAQIAFTIMASFTVCAIFNIDLSRIPRAAYPLAILAISLENIFRLINAVILTPSEDNTSNRIGQAVGATAYTALMGSTQNVMILLGLSRLVSPGVAAFCIFAAVAIVFDFFFHLTFFLAVLSVDVRRTELSDALAKASMRHERTSSDLQERPTWVAGALQGRIGLSTRIAGTIILVGFVLIAQWHFYDEDSIFQLLLRLVRGGEASHDLGAPKTSPLKEVNQARSPTSWLRLQDHETAREVISIIKPTSHSYIARVYEPLVFVKKNSDRIPHTRQLKLLPAVYDFIDHQLTRFLVIVVVIVAALRLLTNYLLWEDEAAKEDEQDATEEPLLSVKSLTMGHSLDVVMLVNAPDGHLISVGLDRAIRVWHVREGASYTMTGKTSESSFPVLAMAVDDESHWLALLSPSRISIWDLTKPAWAQIIPLDNQEQRPEAFFFLPGKPTAPPELVIVQRNGSLKEVTIDSSGTSREFAIGEGPLTSARPLIAKGDASTGPHVYIAMTCRIGGVQIASRKKNSWASSFVSIEDPEGDDVVQILPMTPLDLFLLAKANRVYLVGAETGDIIHVFPTSERLQPRSLQCAHSSYRASRPGPAGLTSLMLCYTAEVSGKCILQTFHPAEDHDAIWLRSPANVPTSSGWCRWEDARKTSKEVENPGVWITLSDGSVVGMRQRPPPRYNIQASTGGDTTGAVRRRFPKHRKDSDGFGRWEVWTASAGGRPEADEVQLLFNEAEKAGHLLISELGPRVKVGLMSAAFSFGNVIKLVTVGGHERFDGEEDDTRQVALTKASGRRRKPGGTPRPRAWS